MRTTITKILTRASLALFVTSMLTTAAFAAKPRRALIPYTRRLPTIDKIELQKLKANEIWIGSIEATKTIDGAEAQTIASLWRSLTYTSFTADCHEPAYGIKFYRKGKVVLYASLCWQCDNVRFMEPKLGEQGFAAKSSSVKQLLQVFIKAFPS